MQRKYAPYNPYTLHKWVCPKIWHQKKCVVVVVFNFCMLPIKTTILKSILTLHTGFLWNIECILHISISLVIIGTMTIIYRNWDTRYTPFFRRSHLVGESYIPLHPCYVYHYEFPAVSPAMWQTKYLEKWKSGNLQPHNGDDSPIHSPWFQSKWGHDNLPRYIPSHPIIPSFDDFPSQSPHWWWSPTFNYFNWWFHYLVMGQNPGTQP